MTPDFEALPAADWLAAPTSGVPTRYVRRVLNCFDESALELALRLRDAAAKLGLTVDLGALCVGGREAEPCLKTLVALGYEQAVRVATRGRASDPDAPRRRPGPGRDRADPGLDFAPDIVAAIIAGYARRAAPGDLLVLGCRSGPGDSGTVPFRVAEALGWPCLTQVTEVDPLPDGRLRVAGMVDDGLLRLTLTLPCVLAVGNAVVSHLRVPTLRDRLARREQSIERRRGRRPRRRRRRRAAPPDLRPLEPRRHSTRPAGAVIEGQTPHEKAQALFDAHLKGMIPRP